MAATDDHGLGYLDVDGDDHAEVLVATMAATSTWEATKALRAWERRHLDLGGGERLLDVGCGRADAALDLGSRLGASGLLVGLDSSASMLGEAASAAATSACPARFCLGDATLLGVADGTFDAVRSERTLQWVTSPTAAVAEFRRVLRPLGRLSLIDTDWSSLRLDIGDPAVTELVARAFREERNRPSNVGARLATIAGEAGFVVRAQTTATQLWSGWNPDLEPAPLGCFSMTSLGEDLIERGLVGRAEADDLVERIHGAARRGRFSMELTMHAILADRTAVVDR